MKNSPRYGVLLILILLSIAGCAYLFLRTSNGVEYLQGPQAVSSGTGSAGTSETVATSSPVNLVSIQPATTTVDATITISGSGFSFAPNQSQVQNQIGNAWLTQDHVIVWLTAQTPQNSQGDNTVANNAANNPAQSILAGIASYGISPDSSASTTSGLTATSSLSAVLWQGSPGSDSDTGISATIGRFLCSQPNSQMGAGTLSATACNQLFAVTPGTYMLTVAIPYLNIVSNPLPLTITAPTLSSEIYTNSHYGYSLGYPDDLTVKENADYPPTPGFGVSATVFTLPKTYYPASTITQASVDVAVANGSCSEWPDGQQTFPVQDTVTINGVVFSVRQDTDVGAGNLYSTTEYSTQVGNQCYRLALYSHLGNPGMYGGGNGEISQYAAANGAAEQMFAAVFNQMAQSFSLTQPASN